MAITVQNMPYLSLIWIGIGFIILVVGIFRIAHDQATRGEYTEEFKGEESHKIEELFSFFLEEQEQKNDALRNTLLNATPHVSVKEEEKTDERVASKEKIPQVTTKNNEVFEKIIMLYEKGSTEEQIAKSLNMGIGEVQLILSLYVMR